METILEARNITKDFPGVRALDNVSFTLKEKQIHALCGENGAGKSTLINVLSGFFPTGSYEGDILLEGGEVHFKEINDAEKAGVAVVHQELSLFNELNVTENIFMGHEIHKHGIMDWNKMHKVSEEWIVKLRLEGVTPETKVSTLGVGKQQLIEIARILNMSNVKVLILDEPTASLADTETRLLHSILRTIRDSGTACIYISHKIEEVMEIADYVTVFRDGKTIGGNEIGAITQPEIIRMMVGRELTEYYPNNGHVPDHSQTVLEIKNFNVREPKTEKQMVEDVSFKLYKGEILAVTGLVGAGRTELMTAVYGATSWLSGGELFINGEKKVIDSPETALKNGIAFVTEDRKDYGIISNLSVRSNTSISTLAQFGSIKGIDSDKEAASVNELVDSLHIKTPSIDTMIVNLSGGNQQKVLLARSLLNDVKVLILDEPTRGIDVGAKYEIYTIMNALVDRGISVVMVSSEMPEVLGMADRVIVMCKGRVTGEFDNTKKNTLSQEQILTCAIGAKVQ